MHEQWEKKNVFVAALQRKKNRVPCPGIRARTCVKAIMFLTV